MLGSHRGEGGRGSRPFHPPAPYLPSRPLVALIPSWSGARKIFLFPPSLSLPPFTPIFLPLSLLPPLFSLPLIPKKECYIFTLLGLKNMNS